jgi:hypothetical protein
MTIVEIADLLDGCRIPWGVDGLGIDDQVINATAFRRLSAVHMRKFGVCGI